MIHTRKLPLSIICVVSLLSIFVSNGCQPDPAVVPNKRTEARTQVDHPAPLPSNSAPQPTHRAISAYESGDTRNFFGPPTDPPPPSKPKVHIAPAPPPYVPQATPPDKIYTGYITLDDKPVAVLEDSETHESTFLKEGDSFEGYTVDHIDPTLIQLSKGKQRRNLLLTDRFNPVPLSGDAPVSAQPDPGNLAAFRGRNGSSFTFQVTGSTAGQVWGTGIYTDDSSLAAASVHAGLLANGEQGLIRVTILPGQDHYDGSNQNGVNSGSYANWEGSYRISKVRNPSGNRPGGQPNGPNPNQPRFPIR